MGNYLPEALLDKKFLQGYVILGYNGTKAFLKFIKSKILLLIVSNSIIFENALTYYLF